MRASVCELRCGRNFRAFDDDAQVLLAKHTPFGQANFQGAKRTIAGICEYIGDVKMDAARRGSGNENLRLAVGKLIAWAKGWTQPAARNAHAARTTGK